MGKKVYFLDSVKKADGSYDNTYGVDDVNAIVSNLVGAGVAPFPSGDTYDVSELNSLTSALVAEGTSLDGLKVSFADNKIHIAQGIGYFENGATIVVDSDGEELDYTVAETLYVYAEYNQTLNTCGFRASESEPSKGTGIYTLMLATISADGTVTDKRVFAQSKVATLGKNVFLMLYEVTSQTTIKEGDVYYEEKIDLSKFNNLVAYAVYIYGSSPGTSIRRYARTDIETLLTGEVIRLTSNTVNDVCLAIQFTDGKLKVYAGEDAYVTSTYKLKSAEIYLC